MVNVVREGPPKNRVTCKECKSLLEYTEDDVELKEIISDDEDEEVTDVVVYLYCPVCKKKIVIG